MQGQYWKKSVQLELAAAGGLRIVTSTDEAARCLLYKWPDQSSKAYHRAKGMCLDALEGRKPDEEARQAFIDAALEAHINVRVQ
ncbi:DUF982 domain-containing protein [Rhizobium sp. TH2]|uniref:DUF982 domain-containing protein n=1 Tax=Rhizobium sp. TH2 TaxID=2775403 RepID=UPI0021572509|nr:DUF982 domain-containing protein [Rhizobium sp. TH2]UVC09798.1 DUF982 domain-containing protein [Rhizobium sp. TH2]